ncbi:location of vulva defective 1-like [Ornithodoros turicata]|uniref:location of vulva defective 1-like n=1 Tax=Ornithodoros turicata TaxID=34597 RepID=UPI003139295C
MDLPLLLFCLCLFPLLGQTFIITHEEADHSFTIDSGTDLAPGGGRTDESSQYVALTTRSSISPESLAGETTMVHHGLEALSGNGDVGAKSEAIPTANAPEVFSEPVDMADDSKNKDSEENMNGTDITRVNDKNSTLSHGHKATNDTGLHGSSIEHENAESSAAPATSTVLLDVSETTTQPIFVNVSSIQDAGLDNAENFSSATDHPDVVSSVLLAPSPTVLGNNEWKLQNLTEDPLDRFDSAGVTEPASESVLSSHNTSHKELLSNNALSSNLSESTFASTGANTEPTLVSTVYRLHNLRLQKAHSSTMPSSMNKVSVITTSSSSMLQNGGTYSTILPTDSISSEQPEWQTSKAGATTSHNPLTMDVDSEITLEKNVTEKDVSQQESSEDNTNDTTVNTFEGLSDAAISALPTKSSAIQTSSDTLLSADFVGMSQSATEGISQVSFNPTATSHMRTSPLGKNNSSTTLSPVQVLTVPPSTSEPAHLSGTRMPATLQEMLVSSSAKTDEPMSEAVTSRQIHNVIDYTANFTSTVQPGNLAENVLHTFYHTVSTSSGLEDVFAGHENNSAQFPDDVHNMTTTPSVRFTDEADEYGSQGAGHNSRNSDTPGEVEGNTEVHDVLRYNTPKKSHKKNGTLEEPVVTESQTLESMFSEHTTYPEDDASGNYSTVESATVTAETESATRDTTELTPDVTTVSTTELHKTTNRMLPVTAATKSRSRATDAVPAQPELAVTVDYSQTLYSEPDVNASFPTHLSVPTSDSFADHTARAATTSHTRPIELSVSITGAQSTVSEELSAVASTAATINVMNITTLSEELSVVASTAATINVMNITTLSEELSVVASTAATINAVNITTSSEELSAVPSTAVTINVMNITTLSEELSVAASTAATINVMNITLSEELFAAGSTAATTNMASTLSEELSTVVPKAATINVTHMLSTLSEEFPIVASTPATMNVTMPLLEKSPTSSVINTTDSYRSTPHPLSTVSQHNTSHSPASTTTCVPLEPPRSPSHEFRLTFETSNDFSWEQVEALERRIQLFLNDTPCSKNFARTAFALGPPHVLSWTNPSVNSSWCDQSTVDSIFDSMANHLANIPTQAMIDTFLPEFHVISVQLQLRGICLESSASSLPAIAGGVVGIALSAALLAGLLTLLWKMLRMTSSRKLSVTPPLPEDSFDLKQRRPVLLPGETKQPTNDGTPQKSPRAKPNPPFVVDTDFCYINPNFLEAVKPSPPPPPPYRRPLDRRVRSLEAVPPSRPNTTVGNRSLGGEPTAELEELNCTSSSSGVESDVQHSGEGGK